MSDPTTRLALIIEGPGIDYNDPKWKAARELLHDLSEVAKRAGYSVSIDKWHVTQNSYRRLS
jgi:hypothetical protein